MSRLNADAIVVCMYMYILSLSILLTTLYRSPFRNSDSVDVYIHRGKILYLLSNAYVIIIMAGDISLRHSYQ